MKKFLSVLLTLALVLTMALTLVACGGGEEPEGPENPETPDGEEVTLVNKTVNGVTLDVPSDFADFAETNGIMIARNPDGQASIGITGHMDGQGASPAAYTEENYQSSQLASYTDVVFVEFNNAIAVDGVPAVYAHCTAVNSKGAKIECSNFLLFFEDGTYQNIVMVWSTQVASSLADNVVDITGSMKIAK